MPQQLIHWFSGLGPGCSSILALLSENGPYYMEPNSTDLFINPFSWNNNANLLYVDQPVGTGFSYTKNAKDYVIDEKQVAQDMYLFLQQFMQAFPKYANLKFAITGESYAGHYIPALSARILAGNAAGQGPKINFAGAAIGNGWTDPKIQYGAYITYAKDNQLISNTLAEELAPVYDACKLAIDSHVFIVALDVCQAGILEVIMEDIHLHRGAPMNPYNIHANCTYPPLCYDFQSQDTLLNTPEVQKALGVTKKWASCNMEVHTFLLGDWITNMDANVVSVLDSDIQVMVYSGDYVRSFSFSSVASPVRLSDMFALAFSC
jgi:carboxypeptidase C (cathepsin A)